MKTASGNIRSMRGEVLLSGPFALALVVAPSVAFPFTFTTIDVPGATRTVASGINRSGQIVGSFSAGGTGSEGFLVQ